MKGHHRALVVTYSTAHNVSHVVMQRLQPMVVAADALHLAGLWICITVDRYFAFYLPNMLVWSQVLFISSATVTDVVARAFLIELCISLPGKHVRTL